MDVLELVKCGLDAVRIDCAKNLLPGVAPGGLGSWSLLSAAADRFADILASAGKGRLGIGVGFDLLRLWATKGIV